MTSTPRVKKWGFAFLTIPLTLRVHGVQNHGTCSRRVFWRASATEKRGTSSRLVCVGDVHGQWDSGDELALEQLRPDLVMFVGDFGNEDIQVTGRISALSKRAKYGIATVFGNHDAFYTAHAYGRSNAPSAGTRVPLQQEQLAKTDASYRTQLHNNIAVVGGRPFSWGGPHWKHGVFYKRYVGMQNMASSSAALCEAVRQVPSGVPLVLLAHSGPTGLGASEDAPCGRDWGEKPGGDWGDEDLRDAITAARNAKTPLPLVVFGHMHRNLRNGGTRKMVMVEGDTVMLNTAVVPRHRVWNGIGGKVRHFNVVEMADSKVQSIEEVWVAAGGEVAVRTELYSSTVRSS